MFDRLKLLIFFVLLEVCVVSWCCFWPLYGNFHLLANFKGWLQLFDYPTSNLDVWLLSILRASVWGLILFAAGCCENDTQANTLAFTKHAKVTFYIFALVLQMYLVIKSMVVAILAPDPVLPPHDSQHPGNVGLLAMYTSLLTALLLGSLNEFLLSGVLSAREKTPEAATNDLQTPLLTNGTTATEETATPADIATDKKEGTSGDSEEEEAITKAPSMKTILKLVGVALPDAWILMTAFTCGFIAALMLALVPFYTGKIIDYASIEPNRDLFLSTTVKLVSVAVLCGVFTAGRGGLFTLAMSRMKVRLQTQLFSKLLLQEIGFYDTNKIGDITSRLTADTSTVADQVTLNMNVMMRSLMQAGMVLFFMFISSWRLTVVTFVLVPMVIAVSQVYGLYFAKLEKKIRARMADASAVANEVLGSMTTVNAHGAWQSSKSIYVDKLAKLFTLYKQEAIAYAGYAFFTNAAPSVVAGGVLFFGGTLVLDKKMSPGDLVSFMLYESSLSSSFSLLGDVFSNMAQAVGAADKVFELMDRKPQVDAVGEVIPDEFRGHIEFRNVIFKYPARPDVTVLNNLSFSVKPGEVVALVGPSGGGKSSVVKLIERFYLASEGDVLVDGRDIGVYEPKWLKRQIALVSQEPVLYARSIKRNIIFGLEKEDGVEVPPTQEEIEEAARQANAADFIAGFPKGYDTDCGEKGVTLSGGQKQRVAIARALVRKPAVLLLDEATSALDADSEAVVQEALDRIMCGRTTIVIAHRLSTIKNAHKIFVIAKGEIQEVGTHDELLKAGGAYATLVSRQLSSVTPSASTAKLTNGIDDNLLN